MIVEIVIHLIFFNFDIHWKTVIFEWNKFNRWWNICINHSARQYNIRLNCNLPGQNKNVYAWILVWKFDLWNLIYWMKWFLFILFHFIFIIANERAKKEKWLIWNIISLIFYSYTQPFLELQKFFFSLFVHKHKKYLHIWNRSTFSMWFYYFMAFIPIW